MRSGTILHQAHSPVMSKNRHTYYHAMLFSENTKITQEKKTFHVEEAWLRKSMLLSDLFDDDLYLLCVISIFATFETGGYLRS